MKPGDIAFPERALLAGREGSVRVRWLGTAGFEIEDDASTPSAHEVDLLLMCTAGWTATERFVPRMLAAVTPGAILLSHWDDFFRPLGLAARPLPALKLPRLFDQLGAHAPRVPVGTLALLGNLWL